MGIFSAIKTAIFGKDKAEAGAQPAGAGGGGMGGSLGGGLGGGLGGAQRGATPSPSSTAFAQAPVTQSTATSGVDVEQRLDAMPGADNLNWRTSIVDLMKLIGVDSSYENRKELAGELGRTDYDGSADDNLWLHKRTMQELAANGGKVPQNLLD